MTSFLLAALLVPQPAPQPQPDLSPMFLPSVQLEAPARLTAGLSVFVPTHAEGGFRRDGYIFEARAGIGGGRIAAGRAGYLEYLGLDARLFLARTWNVPLNASKDSTYAGVEGGVSIAYFRASLGVAQRLSGPSGPYGTVLTWSFGLQVPFYK